MRSTVVSASSLGDRWDPAFHLAAAAVADRVGVLRETLTVDEVADRLGSVPDSAKSSLVVLKRGSGSPARGFAAVESEYPYLALALVEEGLAAHVRTIRERIAGDQAALDGMLALMPEPAAPSM